MTSFGERMKDYEHVSRIKLPKRMPIIIRIDGKAFHTYTRKLKRPYCEQLNDAMVKTAMYLSQNIMGCKLAYTQSDEISLLLTNNDKLTTEAWFDNNLQKMVSIAASMATAYFNSLEWLYDGNLDTQKPDELALFDARAYVLPENEVTNYFIWRQQDATRNSISMLGQSEFSHKELQGVSTKSLLEKLKSERGIDWDTLEGWKKSGVTILHKNTTLIDTEEKQIEHVVDTINHSCNWTPVMNFKFSNRRFLMDNLMNISSGLGRLTPNQTCAQIAALTYQKIKESDE